MRIGVLGGGQLGRMLALAGIPLGHQFRFLDSSGDSPARVGGELVVGAFEDHATLDRFAQGLDVCTYEFENVPSASLEYLAERVPVFPHPPALHVGQDRISEKELFALCGVPIQKYASASTRAEFDDALDIVGVPCVVKTRRMGYDGKGQAVVRDIADAADAWATLGSAEGGLIVEEFVAFEREVSVIGVRARDGAFASYPMVHNVHTGGILRTSIAPASGATGFDAPSHVRSIMERVGYVGVLAVEFFDCGVRGLIANEMAPRVHNSGHWTMDASVCSQFENHVRAITGAPLGSCAFREGVASAGMLNLIGIEYKRASRTLALPWARLHLYGKSPRPGRKMGHVNVTGNTDSVVASRLTELARLVQG
jgi:5-(carboxyamino)imidazole ribonucleotide synthase